MNDPSTNPFDRFDDWFGLAARHRDVDDATAVNLATASADGIPSSRMVLLKGHGPAGFVFYTNLDSRKGKELAANGHAAMCFYWAPLGKQIRIEGRVVRISDDEADRYFASRPLKSRIGAWASRQSQPLKSNATFLKDIAREAARFALREMPRPPFWSGFRLIPRRMEFWENGEHRLHQRSVFTLDEGGPWRHQLLYP